jgi:hypothetical protein
MPASLIQIAARHNTDKALHTHYLENYERYFGGLRTVDVRLLELGIKDGGSLLMWRDYFVSGTVAGLDINPVDIDDETGRIRTYQGRQDDPDVLERSATECAPDGFDIIIDDCAHIGVLARESFRHLFYRHLKTGGWYVIEDWGTGYWETWIDGRAYRSTTKKFRPIRYRTIRAMNRVIQGNIPVISACASLLKGILAASQFNHHDYGMVGFVKELVDELGLPDRTHARFGSGDPTPSPIAEMHVFQSHVFLKKA